MGFLAIVVGFLLQWPTIPTLAMFPVLVVIYRACGCRRSGRWQPPSAPAWDAYARGAPRFLPRLGRAMTVLVPAREEHWNGIRR